MGITVTLRGGSGDMTKAVYDSDLDDVIAKAQLDPKIFYGEKKYLIGNDLLHSHDAGVVILNVTPAILKKTITIDNLYPSPSTLRIKFTVVATGAVNTYTYGRIFKNGVAYGTQRQTLNLTGEEFSEDLSFASGDTLEIYGCLAFITYPGAFRNFRVYGTTPDLTFNQVLTAGEIGDVYGLKGTNT